MSVQNFISQESLSNLSGLLESQQPQKDLLQQQYQCQSQELQQLQSQDPERDLMGMNQLSKLSASMESQQPSVSQISYLSI